MADYVYSRAALPYFKRIEVGVRDSEMTSKALNHMDWESSTEELIIYWDSTLSAENKAILDGIVAACDDDPGRLPTTSEIMTEILEAAKSDQVQLGRLLAALDKYTSFETACNSNNYGLARSRMGLALSNVDITVEDYSIIDIVLPTWQVAY